MSFSGLIQAREQRLQEEKKVEVKETIDIKKLNSIKYVLRMDDEIRRQLVHECNEKTLLNFLDVQEIKPYNGNVPLLKASSSTTLINNHDYKFTTQLYKQQPWLKDFSFTNVLLAGGTVSNIIANRPEITDIDLFFYGLNDRDATTRVKEIIRYLQKCKELDGAKIYKSAHVITITNDKVTVQLILRLYKSIEQILYGFDLGSCAVGFDGRIVRFTVLSAFAFVNAANIIDMRRRSLSYEHRLRKYLLRGFNIYAPHFNVNVIKQQMYKFVNFKDPFVALPLPFVHDGLDIIEKCNPDTKNKSVHVNVQALEYMQWPESDYNPLEFSGLNPSHAFLRHNIRCIMRNALDELIYESMLKDGLEKLTVIEGEFDTLQNMCRFVYSKMSCNISNNLVRLRDVDCFVECASRDPTDEERTVNRINEPRKWVNINVDQQIERCKKTTIPKPNIDWATICTIDDQQGKRISGSFHPIHTTDKEWYGKYYIEFI